MSYTTPYDIANRCLDHLGVSHIITFADGTRNSDAVAFVYDKVRRAELRANPWNFARRRAVLRQLVAGSVVVFPNLWSNSTTYARGDIVFYGTWNGFAAWIALQPSVNIVPTTGLPVWVEYTGALTIPPLIIGTPYYNGELVYNAGFVYLCTVDGSINPALGLPGWHQLSISSTLPFNFFSPLGFTTNQLPTPSKNIFALPQLYLRNMMQDPKRATAPAQITTGGSQALDYELEQGLLLSAATGPIVFRYGADIWLVPWMDDLFCEMMACSMAMELCETITQSPQKLAMLGRMYEDYKAKAVRINAIEAGSTEPDPTDTKMSRNPALETPPQPQQQNQPQGRQR